MNKASSLILLAACSSSPAAGLPDAATSPDPGTPSFDATAAVPPDPPPPDFVCLSHQPPTSAADPLTLAGTAETITGNGALEPVPAVDLTLFVTGQPVVLARTQTDSTGAFASGAVASGGHPLQAYLKGTKAGFRTTFLYPAFPFTKNTMTIPLPMLSDAMFASIVGSLGGSQDDHHYGALLVAVADCKGHLVPGATLAVTRGNSGVATGTIFDLGTILPAAGGLFLTLDVPDGKVHVAASYSGMPLPEHDVFVRAKDPECPTAKGTITATAITPSP